MHIPPPFRPLYLLVAAVICVATAAQATPPLKTEHPHLLTTQAAIDKLKGQLPFLPAAFPAAGGTFTLSITPTEYNPAIDASQQTVYGELKGIGAKNGLFLRHTDKDLPGSASFQIGLLQRTDASNARYITHGEFDLPTGKSARIEFSWNSTTHQVSLKVNDVVKWVQAWPTTDSAALSYLPDETVHQFIGRANESISGFKLTDLNGQTVADIPTIDTPLSVAWYTMINQLSANIVKLQSCPTTGTPSTDLALAVCNVATGHRNAIVPLAQQLGLAYKVTGNPAYLDGALNYVDKMRAVPVTAGQDMSMGGRVTALGLLYDWLYHDLEGKPIPNDGTGRSYRAAMAQTIKDTIMAPAQTGSSNLVDEICGKLNASTKLFSCEKEPAYQNWNRLASPLQPSISDAYMAGMNYSSVYGAAAGMLAIVDDYPEVAPMIDIAYNHFAKGFLAVRNDISIDGGYHSGYSYSIVDTPTRVLLWRSALQNPADLTFPLDWLPKTIYPYIYALRDDHTFPASGDNYKTLSTDTLLGNIALWAASETGDEQAWWFYQSQIQGQRTTAASPPLVLERLFWPVSLSKAVPPPSLDLSAYFRRSGQVLMRDRWTYPDAVLLEFKSTSFMSDNHHHQDQNSISLNYKAPLLIDSGRYDSFGSPHWANYYARSIAHNTIVAFDASERFQKFDNSADYSNDGGQWVSAPRKLYPTIEEVQPSGVNAIGGVINYESAPGYTYTRGNASKAYAPGKFDAADGFVRSVVYLRAPSLSAMPVAVIFDRVQPVNASLPVTFLLHSVNEPIAPQNVVVTPVADGRSTFGFAPGAARNITIRNGGGMVTVQTILPLDAKIAEVGGKNVRNQQCEQMHSTTGDYLPGGANGDCRFTVRVRQADGGFKWRNYRPVESDTNNDTNDVGAWRLEISAPATGSGPTYFMHVLTVADNDNGTAAAMPIAAQRLAGDANTSALLLGTQTVIAFNTGTVPSAGMSWTSPVAAASGKLLACGLQPNTDFVLSATPSGDGYLVQLQQSAPNSTTYHSSKEGVISIGL
ncbi:hypothetical protein RugamoR64_58430 [Duganella rhizosphaerae]|uniref:heparinase II/III domain-containing protein n=1 Tax=Duganella rhizosphaerae TaxID=2885763 RepID=UPI0030E9FE66